MPTMDDFNNLPEHEKSQVCLAAPLTISIREGLSSSVLPLLQSLPPHLAPYAGLLISQSLQKSLSKPKTNRR
ncbi:MAG: hypothetical protein J7525_14145 [Roseofilum sp. SID3]|uniref:hypothetical protein n=1 Tax=Roseofilum sp. SID3 TaxID=2821499 RepID=UPI001B29CC6B|nr:hypothetical protein [Roseofilum sp. SID3]MBP0014234.1 hypothetical protein [Roseofilum sp. SID3]